MKKILQNARSKKLFVAIIMAFFGVLMLPHGEPAMMSVLVFPSVMSGMAFGASIMTLFEMSKTWNDAGMNKTDEAA